MSRWYDKMDDEMIERMKTNTSSLAALRLPPEEGGQPDLAVAFDRMDVRDLKLLNSMSSEWCRIPSENLPLYLNNTYRLREDWERPKRKAVVDGELHEERGLLHMGSAFGFLFHTKTAGWPEGKYRITVEQL